MLGGLRGVVEDLFRAAEAGLAVVRMVELEPDAVNDVGLGAPVLNSPSCNGGVAPSGL